MITSSVDSARGYFKPNSSIKIPRRVLKKKDLSQKAEKKYQSSTLLHLTCWNKMVTISNKIFQGASDPNRVSGFMGKCYCIHKR